MLKHRVLKTQNLQGSLPPDFNRFPYLQVIDFSRNYLNGSIPREWGATQMTTISIIGNRFTGPIPKEIGNISTLVNFTVEFNQFSGVLPPELGNLARLEKLHLTSNNFTGQLPAAFEKLTALKDFRIGDNQFTGEIPNLIQNWTNLQKLLIQGSGLSGPIPPGIAVLEKMTDLRISDLQGNGTGAPFPPLANLKKLKTLVLRSCNIIGRIPDFVGELPVLTTLDLSFNKLDGEIPASLFGVRKADYIYLTGNQLNGTVPAWIIKDGESVDLSYNNFGNESSCQQRNINLFGSASMGNVSGRTVPCLRILPCQKKYYSFHINCGGKAATIEGNLYEDDTDPAGPSRFYQRSNWAVSTTGHFMDDSRPDSYTWTNATKLSANTSSLYMDARLSPTSLTYYGFCMGSGNYTVSLHFAEIMFTNDNTSSSLGRRFFDIYIQVTDQNFILSSSIKDFKPPSENSSSTGTSVGTVVGIVAAAVVFVFLILGILWWKGCFGQKISMRHGTKLLLNITVDSVWKALYLKEEGALLELVDPSLGQDYNEEEVITMINVALLCSNVSAAVRPAMSAVVSMLEGKAAVQDFDIPDKSKSMDEDKIEEMRKHFQVINKQEISETQTQSMSMDGPWTAASTSDADLYPVSLDSDYWKGRD
ncbi:hypothetical protein OIU84_024469 [Salix udensis]|uniref:non-specific serine/threonine protein kinase n=1 Tax=Salix udensis TaxID=889485 RepID=A0AAD6KHD0_9ROSI|nr:hypothetical protein OIU84_024469 [Salix udensis]